MIITMCAIYPHDSVNEPSILRQMDKGKLALMKEYQDLACPKCRKVDERVAISRGINTDVVVRSKRPFLVSSDDFYILDHRGKDVFSSVFPEKIEYYSIPSTPYYVASATICLQPKDSDPGFRFVGGKCEQCHRPREVVWGKVPPTFPEATSFLAINLESVQGARETWIVSNDAAAELRRALPRLTGMVIVPKDVNIDL